MIKITFNFIFNVDHDVIYVVVFVESQAMSSTGFLNCRSWPSAV